MVRRNPGQWQELAGDESRKAGPAELLAYALTLIECDIVARATLRALLPGGPTRKPTQETLRLRYFEGNRKTSGGNKISIKFRDALYLFHREGWVTRGERYVAIRDRAALLNYATRAVWVDPVRLLRVDNAIAQVNWQIRSRELNPAALEQAHKEIAALRKLMKGGTLGASWSGRGSVRRVGPGGSGER